MSDHSTKDLTDTGERLEAIVDEVTGAIEAAERRGERRARADERERTGTTPPPMSGISSSDMEAAAAKACARCQEPLGPIGRLASKVERNSRAIYLATGALILLGYLYQDISRNVAHKLEVLEKMSERMVRVETKLETVLDKPPHGELEMLGTPKRATASVAADASKLAQVQAP